MVAQYCVGSSPLCRVHNHNSVLARSNRLGQQPAACTPGANTALRILSSRPQCSKRCRPLAVQQPDPIVQDYPELADGLEAKVLRAERAVEEVTADFAAAVVDAAATAGLQEAENAQQQRAHARAERARRRAREQMTYKMSAIVASVGVCTAAVAAVYLRFSWHMQSSGDHEFPAAEAIATLLLTFGGVVGMEMWARYAHKALWHDFKPGWALHKSHHEPRVGPFEDNDVFAVMNAVPAFGLCLYGFLTPSLFGGVCFGAGLGITLFGIMYMFIHDGLVHKRFPVGPIADMPYLQRVAAAHKLHHAERYNGVPWGMFLGPQELEAVGAKQDLDELCQTMFPRSSKLR